jgi:hypothetical protein
MSSSNGQGKAEQPARLKKRSACIPHVVVTVPATTLNFKMFGGTPNLVRQPPSRRSGALARREGGRHALPTSF